MADTLPRQMAPGSTCDKCGKTAQEAGKPLKRCAKCQSGKYCSRDCQKADWSVHKRTCGKLNLHQAGPSSSSAAQSGNDPSQDEILAEATRCIDLLEALSTCPEYDEENTKIEPAVLRNVVGFVEKTWTDYWAKLIPSDRFVELSFRFGDDDGEKKKSASEKFEELERGEGEGANIPGGFKRDRWPLFQAEVWSDALSREVMACDIVLDEKKQIMFGGKYKFPEEVKKVAKMGASGHKYK